MRAFNDTFQPYRATVEINGMGAVSGIVDAEKQSRLNHTLLRFKPDGRRARWVAAESVITEPN